MVIVDNGCSDRTLDRIDAVASERVAIRVIACSRKGKGAAVRRAVLSTQARCVGFIDADLSTPIATIGPIMACWSAGIASSSGRAAASAPSTSPSNPPAAGSAAWSSGR